jgi:hypothetical protein
MPGVPSAAEYQGRLCEVEVSKFADDLKVNLGVTIYEEPGSPEPITIIPTDQWWYVDVELWVAGQLRHHLCGKWCLCLYLESIGPAPEIGIPDSCQEIEMDPCGDGYYKFTFRVPPGTVEADRCGTVYIPTVTLGSLDRCGNAGHIFGHCRLPDLMFHPPAH